MRYLIYAVLAIFAILVGYGLTLVFYVMGGPFVQPALFLASLFAGDEGGDTSLPSFLIINTLLCAIPAYLGLAWVSAKPLTQKYSRPTSDAKVARLL